MEFPFQMTCSGCVEDVNKVLQNQAGNIAVITTKSAAQRLTTDDAALRSRAQKSYMYRIDMHY